MRVSLGRTVPLLVVATLLGTATAASGQHSFAYVKAIETYANGDFAGAMQSLETLNERQILNEANRFGQEPIDKAALWLPRARRAAMLHTEAWFEAGEFGVTFRHVHYDAARAIVRAIDRIRAEGGPVRGDPRFVRDWYLVTVSHLHGHAGVARSRPLLVEARRIFPADPEVLLASGSDHEMVSFISAGYSGSVRRKRRTYGIGEGRYEQGARERGSFLSRRIVARRSPPPSRACPVPAGTDGGCNP